MFNQFQQSMCFIPNYLRIKAIPLFDIKNGINAIAFTPTCPILELKMTRYKKEQLHKRLYISIQDLYHAQHFAKYLLKKQLHYKPWEKKGDQYTIQIGLTSSLIVFYCRPFTRSKGLPDLPKDLIPYSSEEIEFHGKILNMRHQVYAHSDGEKFKVRPWALNPNESTSIYSTPFFKLSSEEINTLNEMILRLSNSLHQKQKIMEFELSKLKTGHNKC